MTLPGGDAPSADPGAPAPPADEEVPRLPRGRGLRLSRLELFRVVGLTFVLVFLIATQRPCANAVSHFVTSFDGGGSAAATLPHPGTLDMPAGSAAGGAGSDADRYEHLRPGMTDAEVKAAIERARARAGSASRPSP